MVSRETMLRNLYVIPLILLAVMFMAAFRVGDLTELDAFLDHEANTHFPRSAQNVQMVVQSGSDGVVTDVKRVSAGHWAVEVEIQGGPMKQHQGQRIWFLVKKSDLDPHTGEYGPLRFADGKMPIVAERAALLHDSPGIIQLVNPKSESVAESASQNGPEVSVERPHSSRGPASNKPITIFP
jgi:hypothetical protein